MGAQASKQAVRRLPKEVRRDPAAIHEYPTETPSSLRESAAADLLEEFPEQETRDPQLDKNLRALGPVKVEQTMTKMRTSDPMLHIMRERQRIEDEEERRPGTSIDVIFSALERRKRFAPGDLDKQDTWNELEKSYQLDQPTLKTLYKYYNTMAVLPAHPEDQKKRRHGIWVNDKQEWKAALDEANTRIEEYQKQQQQQQRESTMDTSSSSSSSPSPPSSSSSSKSPKSAREKKLEELFED